MSYRISKAEDVMGPEGIIFIKESKTIEDALNLMKEKKKSKLVVADVNDSYKKVLCMSDLLSVKPSDQISTLTNLRDVEKVSSDSDIESVRKKIEKNPLMIVTKDNRDIGVITVSDMVKALRLM